MKMSAEDEEDFQLISKCWVCNTLFDAGDNTVRDHDHVIWKYRRFAHRSCNIDLKLTKNVPLMFHSLKGYGSHLIIKEIGKSDVKLSVTPNGLEKYMAFTINKNLVFIDSMQFVNSCLDRLVKDLPEIYFKYYLKNLVVISWNQ